MAGTSAFSIWCVIKVMDEGWFQPVFIENLVSEFLRNHQAINPAIHDTDSQPAECRV